MVILYVVLSYLIGTIMSGYLVMKLLTGEDIRTLGSGNVGARNAGRLLGKKGFILTLLGDALKGAIVVLGAKLIGLTIEMQLVIIFAVVVGHIWPVTLKFKGGKGVATYLGSLLVFDYSVFLVFAIIFLVFFLFIRSLTIAGLISFLFIPVIMFFFGYSFLSILMMFVIILGVVLVHKRSISEKLKQRR